MVLTKLEREYQQTVTANTCPYRMPGECPVDTQKLPFTQKKE
jgi:hypothetical protein